MAGTGSAGDVDGGALGVLPLAAEDNGADHARGDDCAGRWGVAGDAGGAVRAGEEAEGEGGEAGFCIPPGARAERSG